MRLSPSNGQRGGASLVVVLLLLLSGGLLSLYLNRHLITEHRSAVNQFRSTAALETAEAGLEWALGLLNEDANLDGACKPTSTPGSTAFRSRYVMPGLQLSTPSGAIEPAAIRVGCRLSGTTLRCSCPATDATFSLGSDAQPSFTVSFASEPSDADAVRVTARGCVADARPCTEADMKETDAHAVVSAVLKLKRIPSPGSSLTCGGSCTLGGSYNVVNLHVPTNGVLINAGTDINIGAGNNQLRTVQGTPIGAALLPNDATLRDLSSADPTCEKSSMFRTYFGMSLEEYRRSTLTTTITCGSASDCESRLFEAYDKGARNFYFASDVKLAGTRTLGSRAQPVRLVTPNALSISGNWTIFGLVFSNSADVNDNGTGNATIVGAQITCANYKNNGNGTTSFDAETLSNLGSLTSSFFRVPGSWRDF